MRAILLALAAVASALTLAPVAQADPGCATDTVRRGFLGLSVQTRSICDGPILADGSWMRHRIIGIPAHYENPHSSCSHTTYSSNCTFYPGGYVAEYHSEDDWYPVRPDTVLPDEPGHLGL